MCAMTLADDELDRAAAVDNLADALGRTCAPALLQGVSDAVAHVHAISPHVTSSRKERYHSSIGFLKKVGHAVLFTMAKGRVG